MIASLYQFFREERARGLLWGFAAAALLYGLGSAPLSGAEAVYMQKAVQIGKPGGLLSALQATGSETPLWFLGTAAVILNVLPEKFAVWGLRLPSAIAALTVLWTIRHLARRFFDVPTAAAAGWMLAGSCVFLIPGRTGLPLMTVSAAAVVTVGCFFLYFHRCGWKKIYFFWILFFAGAWSGGLSTQCAALLFLLPFCCVRAIRRRLLSWHQLPALMLGVLLYLLPLVFCMPDRPAVIPADSWVQVLPAGIVDMVTRLSGIGDMIRQELRRDFAEATPLRTPFIDLWFYCLLPFFALQIAAVWGAFLRWRQLSMRIRLGGFGLLLTSIYWILLPDEGAAPTLLLPCSAMFFSAVLLSEAFRRYRTPVLKGIRMLALIAPAVLLYSVCFFAAFNPLFHLHLPCGAGWQAAACGLIGLVVMLADEKRPSFWSRVSGMPPDLAAQILCMAVLTAFFLCVVVPGDPIKIREKESTVDVKQQ